MKHENSEEDKTEDEGCRYRLKHALHSLALEYFMLSLFLIDVACVIAEIAIESHILSRKLEIKEENCEYDDDHRRLSSSGDDDGDYGSLHQWEEASHLLHLVSLTILCVFLAEALLLLIAVGRKAVNCFWVLDVVVVSISILLAVLTHHAEAGLLILVRLWRFVRIVHGVYVASHVEKVHLEEELEFDIEHEMHIIEKLKKIRDTFPRSPGSGQQKEGGTVANKGLFLEQIHSMTIENAHVINRTLNSAIKELQELDAHHQEEKNKRQSFMAPAAPATLSVL